jgi:hypothetical protein
MTDIDGLTDYRGRCFVIVEAKYHHAGLNDGQRKAVERLVDAIRKPAVCFLASHFVEADEGDIYLAQTVVQKYYFRGRWWPGKGLPLPKAIEKFVKKYGKPYQPPEGGLP